MATRFVCAYFFVIAILCEGGCANNDIPENVRQARLSAVQSIASEKPGDYFVGRRYYRDECKFWGYVRQPGQPWTSSELVVLNENRRLAPDRTHVGSDDGFEYKLRGYFSGRNVYEPRSDGIYSEFVLLNSELISKNPSAIFRSQHDARFAARNRGVLVEKPE